jgi:hypothetical protein
MLDLGFNIQINAYGIYIGIIYNMMKLNKE